MIYCLVFVSAFILDWCYTKWTKAVIDDKAVTASIYSGTITALAAMTTIIVVRDTYAIVPAVIGHMAGTWIAMKLKKSHFPI